MRLRPLAALVTIACFALALAWWPTPPGAVSAGAALPTQPARAGLAGTPLPPATPAAPPAGFGPRLLLAGIPTGQQTTLRTLALAIHAAGDGRQRGRFLRPPAGALHRQRRRRGRRTRARLPG